MRGLKLRVVLARALDGQCPRCAATTLFGSWSGLNGVCTGCGLVFIPDAVDLGMFLYLSTAGVTGVFVVGFLLLDFPQSWTAKGLMVAGALSLMWGTLRWRKALAVALNYWVSQRVGS